MATNALPISVGRSTIPELPSYRYTASLTTCSFHPHRFICISSLPRRRYPGGVSASRGPVRLNTMKDRYFSPETRRSIADIARKRGLSLVVLFGSVAANTARPDSATVSSKNTTRSSPKKSLKRSVPLSPTCRSTFRPCSPSSADPSAVSCRQGRYLSFRPTMRLKTGDRAYNLL
jgi:hypothetical protein